MGEAEKKKQAQIQERIVQTKTCSRCGLEKPKDIFSGRSVECNQCKASTYVTCGCGCKRKMREERFEIYAVREEDLHNKGIGVYFVNQEHHDRHWNITRDSKGYVSETTCK